MTGDVLENKKIDRIQKPNQLGAFVTAYSRKIMLFYMKAIDPTLETMAFTYTDTDSLHIMGEAYLRLIKMGLIDGPFKHLDGEWRFKVLSDEACKIEFVLHYEFSNKLLDTVLGPVFNYIANSFVEAFIQRAEQVYGAS